jgi:hypothetical protein
MWRLQTMPHQALLKYQANDISLEDAVNWIYSEISELDDGKRTIERELATLRDDLSVIVGSQPRMALELAGLPKMQITRPSARISYNNRAVDDVIEYLEWTKLEIENNHGKDHVLEYIISVIVNLRKARKETQVAGGLRIGNYKKS